MTRLAMPKACLVREVSGSFSKCLRSEKVAIDVEAARLQHQSYVALLEDIMGNVLVLPSSPEHPDCCYIEDTAVVVNNHAVLTRPGAVSRRGEVDGVGKELKKWCEVHTMPSPATLDGGDVMRIGIKLLVGLTERTNREGAGFLTKVAGLDEVDVITVPVEKGLHLKSACTMVDETTAIFNPELIDPLRTPIEGLTWLPAPDPLGANVLVLGNAVVVSEDTPQTAELLKLKGFNVQTVRVTEFHKGDGALTCLSIRIPSPNSWAA